MARRVNGDNWPTRELTDAEREQERVAMEDVWREEMGAEVATHDAQAREMEESLKERDDVYAYYRKHCSNCRRYQCECEWWD